MAAGDGGLRAAERQSIDRAIRDAETASRLEFSVFVGAAGSETRPFAERLHAALVAPARSVQVVVDPTARIVEVVTGPDARRVLDDSAVGLAVMTMQSAFAAGDLAGGIVAGVHQLAEHARRPQVRHGGP